MASEDYELFPQQVIEDLKYEVEALKKRLMAPDAKINELILEIESLKESIHDLYSIFQQALSDVKGDESSHNKKLDDTLSKVDTLMQQNETIAKGMVAIADKVDDFVAKYGSLAVSSSYPGSEAPSSSAMSGRPNLSMGSPALEGSRMAPPPNFSDFAPSGSTSPGSTMSPDMDNDFPPPPPGLSSSSKRRGLFK